MFDKMSRYHSVSSTIFGDPSYSDAYQFIANKQKKNEETEHLSQKHQDFSCPVLSSTLSNIPRKTQEYKELKFTPSPDVPKSSQSIVRNYKKQKTA